MVADYRPLLLTDRSQINNPGEAEWGETYIFEMRMRMQDIFTRYENVEFSQPCEYAGFPTK